jgi:hypothetical protein
MSNASADMRAVHVTTLHFRLADRGGPYITEDGFEEKKTQSAAELLPKLRQHLQMAQEIRAYM